MGVVCAKHDQYYEKECQWCEPPEIAPPILSAEEFNAHIAEAAAAGKASRMADNIAKNNALLLSLRDGLKVTEMPRWPKDKAT